MQSKIANKVLVGILSVGLMLQMSMPIAYAEEITPIQETKAITAFADLAEDVKNITVPMGTTEEELALPETVTAVVYKETTADNTTEENQPQTEDVTLAVTWESDKTFSQEESGEYSYTAKLTEESYTLAEGVKMPAITVNVVNQPTMLFTQTPDMTLVEGAVNGGDINVKGLDLSKDTPPVMSQYKAGDGYVLFTPATDASGKNTIELNDATLEATENVGSFLMVLPSGNVDLIIKGENKLIRDRNCTIYGRNCKLKVTGEGTLSATNGDILLEDELEDRLEDQSTFTCDENTSENLKLMVIIGNSTKNKQEIFGSTTVDSFYNEGHVNLVLHKNAELTLQNDEDPISLYGNLDIGKNAKLIIDEDTILKIEEDDDVLPVLTNNGGSIIVKGELSFDDSSYAKDITKMNITTEGTGTVVVDGGLVDPVSGKVNFNDSEGIRLSGTNGGEYSCGQGTMKWEPVVDDTGNLIGGTLTLNNADIIMKEGNKEGAISVEEGKSVPITLKLEGNNGIENPYNSAGIDIDDINLAGSGTLTGKGEKPIVYGMKFDTAQFSGKLNSLVLKVEDDLSHGHSWYGTAYGTVSYRGGEHCQSMTVEKDATLTIEPGAFLRANAFTNNGTVINNGTLNLQRNVNEEELKNWVYDSLKLKGDGIVKVSQEEGSGYALFTNDGRAIHDIVDTHLDFSNVTEDKGDLAKDGYHWDNQNKKLTLENLNMWGNPSSDGICAITLPEGKDVTLELKGYNKIEGFNMALFHGIPEMSEFKNLIAGGSAPEAKGSLTICGDGTLVTGSQVSDKHYKTIFSTAGKLILQSGNLIIGTNEEYRIAAVGMEIKGGSLGSETFCAPIECFGDFTMNGGKVITGEAEVSLLVRGNLTITGGELITGKGTSSISLINGNLTITGGKLTVQNVLKSKDSPTMGIEVAITGKEDKKISISGGTVDIKSNTSAVTFAAYLGGTGKAIFETNGMTLTTNPARGTLKSATISIPGSPDDDEDDKDDKEQSSGTIYAITADESLKISYNPMGGISMEACTSLTAVKASSNGGGSGHHSGGSSAATTSSTEKTNTSSAPTQAKATVTSTVTNGTANVTVAQSTVAEVIKKAQEEAKKNGSEKNGIAVEIKVDTKNSNASNLSANLPKAAVDTLVKEGVKKVIINSDSGKMDLDLEALKTIQKQVGADVNVSVKKVDNSTLSAEAKAVVGNRPVFDFAITGANGTKVTDFGKGKITVSIPYTLGANEKAENVVAYYIDNEGKIQEMPNCVYDEKTKTLSFVTDHFSMYAVGYKADTTTAFTDIATHWAKEEIQFVTAKGLFSGTAQGKFSPNVSMTRGMFVTVLGRLANADVSSYTNSSFGDVKANAYYMPYVQWAGEKGIAKEISKEGFAPDQSITREQMALIMVSYAKATGFELPQVNKESTFVDNGEISSYAKEAVKQMQMAGVLSGKDGNKFDPKGTATRAEVSAVLKRFAALVEKN